jgi:hypothetical protein
VGIFGQSQQSPDLDVVTDDVNIDEGIDPLCEGNLLMDQITRRR